MMDSPTEVCSLAMYHSYERQNTILYIEKQNVGCKVYGLILLFCLIISKALILATTI